MKTTVDPAFGRHGFQSATWSVFADSGSAVWILGLLGSSPSTSKAEDGKERGYLFCKTQPFRRVSKKLIPALSTAPILCVPFPSRRCSRGVDCMGRAGVRKEWLRSIPFGAPLRCGPSRERMIERSWATESGAASATASSLCKQGRGGKAEASVQGLGPAGGRRRCRRPVWMCVFRRLHAARVAPAGNRESRTGCFRASCL